MVFIIFIKLSYYTTYCNLCRAIYFFIKIISTNLYLLNVICSKHLPNKEICALENFKMRSTNAVRILGVRSKGFFSKF